MFLDAVFVLFASKGKSVLYSWNSHMNQFSEVLKTSSANHFATVNVRSLNSNKSLIILSEDSFSCVYELTTVSSQSDFIPR